jgi:hypothetical protein
MSARSPHEILLHNWRHTARALDALTNPDLSQDQSFSRFKNAVRGFPPDAQVLALHHGMELRGKGWRLPELRVAG